jgi:hypothetical protein
MLKRVQGGNMNSRLRLSLVPLLAVVAFAMAPAAAQAFVPKWEVKGTSGGWKKLPLATTETLHSSIQLGLVGQRASGVHFKTTCSGTDTETIENELVSEEGIDSMTTFEALCGEVGPDPCSTGETFTIRGGSSLPWPSELVYVSNDAFENVSLEVKCTVSGTPLTYHPPAHLWNPKIGTDALKSNAAAGVFKAGGGRYFYLTGTDTLTPTSYVKVR